MSATEEPKFIKNNTITKEEFLAQFEDKSIEIVVEGRYCWHKGNGPFLRFGKESLASFNYGVPWLNDPEGDVGEYGDIFWFCKKSMFGYPYKPEFKTNKIYRLRVRPARVRVRPNYRYFYLEEVLEKDVDISGDGTIYQNALEKYYKDTETTAQEISIILRKDVDLSDYKSSKPYLICHCFRSFNVIRYAGSGKTRMIEGVLEIPYDKWNFKSNLNLKLKAGSIIRITARKRISDDTLDTYIFDKLLEADVKDDELKNLNKEVLTPGKWHIEGEDDFDVKDGEATGIILWDSSDNNTEVGVSLACDPDNLKSASLSTKHFSKILNDKEAFEQAVFETVLNNLVDEDGMITTWEGESEGDVRLTKDECKKRLSIISISLSSDGSGSVLVDLDEMFTDHAYNVDICSDGTYKAHGLIG